jgi:hypothetical protein
MGEEQEDSISSRNANTVIEMARGVAKQLKCRINIYVKTETLVETVGPRDEKERGGGV